MSKHKITNVKGLSDPESYMEECFDTCKYKISGKQPPLEEIVPIYNCADKCLMLLQYLADGHDPASDGSELLWEIERVKVFAQKAILEKKPEAPQKELSCENDT